MTVSRLLAHLAFLVFPSFVQLAPIGEKSWLCAEDPIQMNCYQSQDPDLCYYEPVAAQWRPCSIPCDARKLIDQTGNENCHFLCPGYVNKMCVFGYGTVTEVKQPSSDAIKTAPERQLLLVHILVPVAVIVIGIAIVAIILTLRKIRNARKKKMQESDPEQFDKVDPNPEPPEPDDSRQQESDTQVNAVQESISQQQNASLQENFEDTVLHAEDEPLLNGQGSESSRGEGMDQVAHPASPDAEVNRPEASREGIVELESLEKTEREFRLLLSPEGNRIPDNDIYMPPQFFSATHPAVHRAHGTQEVSDREAREAREHEAREARVREAREAQEREAREARVREAREAQEREACEAREREAREAREHEAQMKLRPQQPPNMQPYENA